MFNKVCYGLNRVKLAWLAAVLRWLAAQWMPTKECPYSDPAKVAGYLGWVETPAGVVAFRRDDGSLQWSW